MVDCEYRKLIKASNKVPACGDISGNEYRKSKDRERVHQPSRIDCQIIDAARDGQELSGYRVLDIQIPVRCDFKCYVEKKHTGLFGRSVPMLSPCKTRFHSICSEQSCYT